MQPSIENRVIVRVWTSYVNHVVPQQEVGEKKAEAGVGHIAIEIKDLYLSLWPENTATCEEALVTGVPGVLNCYEEDERLEGRPPERTICLYTLESETIRKTFKRSLLDLQGWTLLGGTRLINRDNSIHSCSSFAQMLLEAGGLENILKGYEFLKKGPRISFVSRASDAVSEKSAVDFANFASVSPDSLLTQVARAKFIEINQWPETKTAAYQYASESSLAEIKISAERGGFGTAEGKIEFGEKTCRIM